MTIKSKILKATALAGVLLSSPAFSDDVLDHMDGSYDRIENLASKLWDYAEVGYQENKSTKLMQDILKAEGFKVEAGVAGIPTAFVASYGSGGPVIGILAEMDALPGINQDAVPHRQPIEGKGAGQACGHNLFGAGSVEAAIAVKKWLASSGQKGTIRLYGTPAEEGGSGKVYMVREGLLKDVDFAIHWHASSANSAAAATTLANRSAKFRFKGVSAHAAGAPEKARSALDGVEAMNNMVNMMREHVPQETRIHYVITKGGFAPNVVPDAAEVFYYVRHPKSLEVKNIWERVENAARGAATGTGTEVEWEIIHGNHPVVVNEALQKMADAKMRQVGGVTYTKEEQEFAEAIYKTLNAPNLSLGSESQQQPYRLTSTFGSTDVGDVSIAVPTVGISTATWVPGTPAHSWQAVAASGMSIGYKGTDNAAKSMALIAQELFTNPELRAAAKAEHKEKVGDDFVYEALLGDRKPPLDYRK
ncbi:peptidase M20 [Kordiimonas sediminis]|uniref:Peptidase M20 n=1 Tax=Kordiimonas sediminis TaxID=1735581 RepID=A0A919EAJ3_9PROT|nr:amidohydrolase [Kordiimonas sediminis]GHF30299.1 peptidase M20 [Kordiimonas sediminis]